ncbi:hypothetical protein DY000_02039731 [Brassica cretica]|uniref:Uncharacterized protein n=1 Tax=Brassica cretica TaxID=69181 RepID=A0ABQ7BM17_BRACR|nr:hypothetical protein DY000_02039731 [Brassica cretica]
MILFRASGQTLLILDDFHEVQRRPVIRTWFPFAQKSVIRTWFPIANHLIPLARNQPALIPITQGPGTNVALTLNLGWA